MTPEQALAAVGDHILIRHAGQVFFNTTDEREAISWERQGARLRPHFTDMATATRKRLGNEPVQGWEVHIVGAVDPIWEDDGEGNEVEVTAERLLELARQM